MRRLALPLRCARPIARRSRRGLSWPADLRGDPRELARLRIFGFDGAVGAEKEQVARCGAAPYARSIFTGSTRPTSRPPTGRVSTQSSGAADAAREGGRQLRCSSAPEQQVVSSVRDGRNELSGVVVGEEAFAVTIAPGRSGFSRKLMRMSAWSRPSNEAAGRLCRERRRRRARPPVGERTSSVIAADVARRVIDAQTSRRDLSRES